MTDKVQKIKDWISKEQDGLMDAQGNFEYPEHEGAYHILCNLDTYIDSLQEEPVSIWHDASEEPKPNMELICIGQYDNPLVLSSNSDSFKSRYISKWAYFNDLLNLSNVQRTVKDWKEEPVSEDLEEAARKVGQKYFPNEENIWARPNYEAKKAECAFKDGAKWERNQAKVEIQAQSMALPNGCPNKEPANDDLEEAAMQYAILKHKDAALQKIVSWDFKAGAEWQKEQFEKNRIEILS